MSDPFRRLFLDQVDIIVKKDPSREVLLTLLQLATPGLVSLGSATETKKTFRALLLRVHPDKHPDDQRATRICQDVKTFYDKCMASAPSANTTRTPAAKKQRTGSSPNNTLYPLEFNAINKWSHIQYDIPYVQPQMTSQRMSNAVAYQCINARGAIAHGKKIELHFGNSQIANCLSTSVEQVFSSFGGTKQMHDIDEIKDELMKNGPVVSTSFCPTDAFLSTNSIGKSDNSIQNKILVVGWKQLASGEVWIVQPLYHNGGLTSQVVYVAMGQFGIDNCCLAPKSNLENKPWQPGPYYNANMTAVENVWRTARSINCHTVSIDSLFKDIGTISLGVHPTVTVRDKIKLAHSRKATLTSVEWVQERHQFKLTFNFIR